jgi:signal transduction histidine kinase
MRAAHAIAVCCFLLPAAMAAPPLTRLAEVRALSPEEAGRELAVRVEGTVVAIEPSTRYQFFLHDGADGCFIRPFGRVIPKGLAPGDQVMVEGISDALGYYPSVREARVRVLGKRGLPAPLKPGAGEMFAPELDSQWVEVPAMIIGSEMGDDRVTLSLEVHGLPFKAELPITHDALDRAAALMQRPVLVRGVMGTIFNRQRQMTDRHFFVSSFDEIRPTAPEANGDGGPLLTVDRLLAGGYGPSMLVRLQGVVTQLDAKGFYLRDGGGSTLIQAAAGGNHPPGTKVEVEGYAAVSPFRPVLRATHVKSLGEVAEVVPLPFDLQKFDPRNPDLASFHSEWVTLDAVYLGRREGPVESVFQFEGSGRFFEALRPASKGDARLELAVGDRVRLTGICELTTTHALPRMGWVDGFRIRLPAAGGSDVISRAPWWNSRRLFIALGIACAVALLGMIWTWVLRRRVKSQMAVISDKLRAEAVGGERDRMARELHDTLEQQLLGVALQLDRIEPAVRESPAAATLSLARHMLRFTRLEARRSVWELRSKELEEHGLAAALRALAEAPEGSGGPSISVHVSGNEHPLPSGVDFHLLRIAQEAVTNATKHGAARHIELLLEYEPGSSRLTIRDDGRGFAPPAANSVGAGFGLLGMRERTAKIGASLSIHSAPGDGCTITVTIPNNPSGRSS